MNLKITILLPAIILLIAGCEKQQPSDDGYVAPDVPSEVNENNLLSIEFYSRMDETTLFETNDYQSVVSHIAANKTPLAFLFDRSDATIGNTSPVVDIAWQSRLKSFFIQNQTGDTQIKGTGMIVRSLVPGFEGFAVTDTLFLAGCRLTAPLSQPTVVTIMTCKLTESCQFPVLVRCLGGKPDDEIIIIGTIKASLKEEMSSYLRYNMTDFRLSFVDPEDTGKSNSLFILSSIKAVYRESKELTMNSFPLFQCNIEYINQ